MLIFFNIITHFTLDPLLLFPVLMFQSEIHIFIFLIFRFSGVLLPSIFVILDCMQDKDSPLRCASNSGSSSALFHVSSAAAQSLSRIWRNLA